MLPFVLGTSPPRRGSMRVAAHKRAAERLAHRLGPVVVVLAREDAGVQRQLRLGGERAEQVLDQRRRQLADAVERPRRRRRRSTAGR